MMGPRQEAEAALFYEFCLEDHVAQGHLLRSIDRFVDLSDIRQHLTPFYSSTGRPSVDIIVIILLYCMVHPPRTQACNTATLFKENIAFPTMFVLTVTFFISLNMV